VDTVPEQVGSLRMVAGHIAPVMEPQNCIGLEAVDLLRIVAEPAERNHIALGRLHTGLAEAGWTRTGLEQAGWTRTGLEQVGWTRTGPEQVGWTRTDPVVVGQKVDLMDCIDSEGHWMAPVPAHNLEAETEVGRRCSDTEMEAGRKPAETALDTKESLAS